MNKIAFKRGARNGWVNATTGGGTCFTLSYNALEDLLKNGIGRRQTLILLMVSMIFAIIYSGL